MYFATLVSLDAQWRSPPLASPLPRHFPLAPLPADPSVAYLPSLWIVSFRRAILLEINCTVKPAGVCFETLGIFQARNIIYTSHCAQRPRYVSRYRSSLSP